jgi:hypothetical protein
MFLATAVTFVKVLKQAPVATSYMLTRLETFQPQGGEESFYSTAVAFVKVLKQWGLGLNMSNNSLLLLIFNGRNRPMNCIVI